MPDHEVPQELPELAHLTEGQAQDWVAEFQQDETFRELREAIARRLDREIGLTGDAVRADFIEREPALARQRLAMGRMRPGEFLLPEEIQRASIDLHVPPGVAESSPLPPGRYTITPDDIEPVPPAQVTRTHANPFFRNSERNRMYQRGYISEEEAVALRDRAVDEAMRAAQSDSDKAMRGSPFNRWLWRWRESYPEYAPEYKVIDAMLEDYREHADTGTSLNDPIIRSTEDLNNSEGWRDY